MIASPIILWSIHREKVETVTEFIFFGSKITVDGDCSHEIRRQLFLGNLWQTLLLLFSHSVMSNTATCQASLSFSIPGICSLMSIESMMPFNCLILCCPLLLLLSIFHSIRVFSNESALRIRWPKYWSFSFSISPSNHYSGLISFRFDWLDLLAVYGVAKSWTWLNDQTELNSSITF